MSAVWPAQINNRNLSSHASSYGRRADCYAELTISSPEVTETIPVLISPEQYRHSIQWRTGSSNRP